MAKLPRCFYIFLKQFFFSSSYIQLDSIIQSPKKKSHKIPLVTWNSFLWTHRIEIEGTHDTMREFLLKFVILGHNISLFGMCSFLYIYIFEGIWRVEKKLAKKSLNFDFYFWENFLLSCCYYWRRWRLVKKEKFVS